jgi:hypothetical protein
MSQPNYNQFSKTQLIQEIKKKEYARRRAWTSFYNLFDENLKLYEKLEDIKKSKDQSSEFLLKQFVEMFDELKKKAECPICYDALKKDNLSVSSCGHLHCKECIGKIEECSICKRKLF